MRRRRGWEWLGRESGVTPITIWYWRQGRVNFSAKVMDKVLAALDLELRAVPKKSGVVQ